MDKVQLTTTRFHQYDKVIYPQDSHLGFEMPPILLFIHEIPSAYLKKKTRKNLHSQPSYCVFLQPSHPQSSKSSKSSIIYPLGRTAMYHAQVHDIDQFVSFRHIKHYPMSGLP